MTAELPPTIRTVVHALDSHYVATATPAECVQMAPDVYAAVRREMTAGYQYQGGGVEALSIDGVPLRKNRKIPRGRWYVLSETP